LKPAPVNAALLMVTGKSPADVRVTYCVAVELTPTLPNGTLLMSTASLDMAALVCDTELVVSPPRFTGDVDVCTLPADVESATDSAVAAFDGTVGWTGTVATGSPLDMLPVTPLPAEAPFELDVHGSAPATTADVLLHETPVNARGNDSTVPMSPITTVGLVDDVLVIASWPDTEPAEPGLNCTAIATD